MLFKNKKNIFPFFIILSFLLALLSSGILLGLTINLIYGKFSLTLLKIAFINSFFLSLGIIFNISITRIMPIKLNKFLMIILSIFIILGVSLIGFIYLIFTETFFFIYEINLVYSYLLINLLFIICIGIITTGFNIYQKMLNEKESIIIEEKYLRKQVEQKLYISKINPHFLFNSLNLMISLLDEPKKAEKALIYLSDLLRFNIDIAEKEKIPIKDEIRNIEKYLFIQKLRFENRFSYKINCKIDTMIPPLLLQPLVENSIKYNIKNTDKLIIEIDVYKNKNNLYINVIDSCKCVHSNMIGKGTGLENTKKRVEINGGKFIIMDGGVQIIFKYD